MISKPLQHQFNRIRVAKCAAWLESNTDLYREGKTSAYLREMQLLHHELKLLPAFPVDVLQQMQLMITHQKVSELDVLSNDIQDQLDDMFTGIQPVKGSNRIRSLIVMSILLAIGMLLYSPLRKIYYEEREAYNLVANAEFYKIETFKNILGLQSALQKYFSDNKAYPSTNGAWITAMSQNVKNKNEWIPGLVPKYINAVHTDPRKSKEENKQYMYLSDGKDFKLIAHHPVGIEAVIKDHPEMVDPPRPSWAYGVWTEGAENW